MQPAEMTRRFSFHPVGDDTERAAKHERIRAAGRTLAELLVDVVPEGPERDTAISKVEEAVFWGNAGLARPPYVEPIRTMQIRSQDPRFA